jgi:hypothetical protein
MNLTNKNETQSQTLSVSINRSANDVYDFTSDPRIFRNGHLVFAHLSKSSSQQVRG